MGEAKKVVSFDVDDVLIDFVGGKGHGFIGHLERNSSAFLDRYGFDSDKPLTRDDYNNIYFARKVIGCSPEEERALINGFFLDDYFTIVRSNKFPEGIRPIEGAIEGIGNLVEKGCDLIANTSRPTWIEHITESHLENYFPDSFKKIYSSNGHVVSDVKKSKREIAREVGAICHIDDCSAGLDSFLGWEIPVIVLSAPWNQYCIGKDILYAKNWKEVVRYIDEIKA